MGTRPSSSSRSNLDVDAPALRSVDSIANRMEGLKLSDSIAAKTAEPTSSHSTKDDVLVKCAQCCGIFVKATASLDSEGKASLRFSRDIELLFASLPGPDLTRHTKEAIDAVRRYCKLMSNLDFFISADLSQPLTTLHASTDPELLRARGKLERALERLRRAGLRILDAPQIQNQDTRQAAMSLLEAIATALEDSLARVRPHSYFLRSTDIYALLLSGRNWRPAACRSEEYPDVPC